MIRTVNQFFLSTSRSDQVDFSNAFVISVDTRIVSGTDEYSIRIPLANVVNLTVDWGDGYIQVYEDQYFVHGFDHTYASPGIYQIKILGHSSAGLAYSNRTDRDSKKILDIVQWGSDFFCNGIWSFWGCSNMDVTAVDAPLGIVNINFRECFSLVTSGDWTNWDMSSCESFNLYNCPNIVCDMSGFDLSNCLTQSYRFCDFRVIKCQNWKMPVNFGGSGTFRQCVLSSYTLLDTWDISLVREMNSSFYLASLTDADISGWDVSLVQIFKRTFWNCNLGDNSLTSWVMDSAISIEGMFFQSNAFSNSNPTDVSNWNVSSVEDFSNFAIITTGAINVENWDTSNGKYFTAFAMRSDIRNNNLNLLDFSSAEVMDRMFEHNVSINTTLSFDPGLFDIRNLRSAAGMLHNNTLPTGDYDNILIGFASQQVQRDVVFSGGNSKYSSAGATARQQLIDLYNWTITDGGQL